MNKSVPQIFDTDWIRIALHCVNTMMIMYAKLKSEIVL